MHEIKPPIAKNINEVRIDLLWERIQIAIEQMPIPVSQSDDARLAAAEAKMCEVLAVLTGEPGMQRDE